MPTELFEVKEYPSDAVCVACAALLSNIVGQPHEREFTEKDEKSDWDGLEKLKHSQYQCCGRYVCTLCLEDRPSLGRYCLFCLSPRLVQPGQKNAKEAESGASNYDPPPPYSSIDQFPDNNNNNVESSDRISAKDGYQMHYLHPEDTIPKLSLMYSTPVHILRSCNKLFSDHLLKARSYVLIPRTYYKGPSKSPDPIQTEHDSLLKRFQVRSKCVNYDVAKVYLEGSDWDLDLAVQWWEEDDRWEKEFGKTKKGKATMHSLGFRL